jgi:hypothetical protein
MIKIYLPIRIKNPLNGDRLHWTKIAKARKSEREAAWYVVPSGLKPPLTVTLTRIAPRMFDDDNLGAAFKSIRDGIADKVGVDDGSAQIAFKYAQRRGKPKEYAIEISIL